MAILGIWDMNIDMITSPFLKGSLLFKGRWQPGSEYHWEAALSSNAWSMAQSLMDSVICKRSTWSWLGRLNMGPGSVYDICTSIYTHIYLCMYIYICTYMNLYVCMSVYYIYMYTFVCMYMHMSMYMRMYLCICCMLVCDCWAYQECRSPKRYGKPLHALDASMKAAFLKGPKLLCLISSHGHPKAQPTNGVPKSQGGTRDLRTARPDDLGSYR